MRNKVISATEAVKAIKSGSTLTIGGNTIRRHPLGLVREIIRQEIKDLTIYVWVAGIDVDLLVGAGCVRRVEAAYVGMGPLGFAPNVRRAVQEGRIEYEDFSETSMLARLRAAGMGLPYLPTKVLLGTGMAQYATHAKPVTCPFTGGQLYAVSAAKADVAILHGYYGDVHGNIQWPMVRNTDDIDPVIAKSADHVIFSVEQLIDPKTVMSNPTMTYIPHNWVNAVVEMPYGAHPGTCDGIYDPDSRHLEEYMEAAKSDDTFKAYLDKYVFGTKDDFEYLEQAAGLAHLLSLRVSH
ncbi:MAG TPA: CoA-transferase [Anaerolineaceae bacterium]|nr:CoA-transferase [Anaerolineaceae bacterium]